MKYLILLLVLTGCISFDEITTSAHRCDNKVGVEKKECLESYKRHERRMDYLDFRGGGRKDY